MSDGHGIDILVWGDQAAAVRVRLLAERFLGAGLPVGDVQAPVRERAAWERAAAKTGAGALLTVGGAGFPAGEIVPDVCSPLIRRPVPGIPEAIREAGLAITPLAALFRGIAGVTGDGRLLVNLPDEGPWLEASLALLTGLLGHALDKAAGDPRDCGRVG